MGLQHNIIFIINNSFINALSYVLLTKVTGIVSALATSGSLNNSVCNNTLYSVISSKLSSSNLFNLTISMKKIQEIQLDMNDKE